MKEILGHPGYFVDTDGNVWSGKPPSPTAPPRQKLLMMQIHKQNSGYLTVKLRTNGKQYTKLVHRLVLAAFRGCPLKEQEARHLNGIRTDNRLENLQWGTRVENIGDQLLHGTDSRGCNNGMSRLSESDVRNIRAMEGSVTQRKIARLFGISQSRVSGILRGETYRSIK